MNHEMCELAMYLPVSRKTLEEAMSHIEDVLNEIADKLDAGIDAVLANVQKLEDELKRGGVRPETVQRLRDSAERLHKTVDEEVTEGEEEEHEHETE